jgi:hypothetical protein
MIINRITRVSCSLTGMVFLVFAALAGLWAGLNCIILAKRTLFAGIIGLAVGFIAGQILTHILRQSITTADLKNQDDSENETPEKTGQKELKEFQPWSPPRVSRNDD